MPKQFIKKRPLTSFALLTTLCLALGVVVTQVQANIPSSAENIANNTLSRIFLHPVTFVDTRFLAGIFFVANTEPCRVYGF